MTSSSENEAQCLYYFRKYLRVDKNNLSRFSGVGSPACSCLAGTGIGVGYLTDVTVWAGPVTARE